MKWIGKHIWDFVSRFRNDVYLEDVDTGTIVSGGNLGLDSNNKIVKNTVSGGAGDITSVGAGTNLNGGGTSGAVTLNLDTSIGGLDSVEFANGDNKIHARENLDLQFDTNQSGGTNILNIKNGAGDVVGKIDNQGNLVVKGGITSNEGGTIPDKGSAGDFAVFDSNVVKRRTGAEVKTDSSINNVENKSSATIRGEIVSGDIPNNAADTSGNAGTATSLATARSINGVSFDGSSDITINNKETLHINIVSSGAANTQDYVGYGGHYNFNIGGGNLSNNTTKNNNWASKWSHYRCLEDTTIKQAKAYVSTSANFNSQIRFFKTSPNLGATSVVTLTHLFDLDFTGNASNAYVSEDTNTSDHSLSAGDLLLISVKKGTATSGTMFAELSVRLEY